MDLYRVYNLTRILLITLISVWMSCSSSLALDLSLTEEERRWLSEHKTIRVSGPQAFPPFQFFDENEQYTGVASDYLEHIAHQLGITISYLPPTPWAEVLEMMEKKEIDLLTCAAFTEKRSEYMLFSSPHIRFPLMIINRKNDKVIQNIDDIQGLKVAIKQKISTQEALQVRRIEYSPVYVNSPAEALQAVALSQADAAIENLAAASYIIEKEGFTNLKISAPTNFDDYALSIAVRKDWPIFQSILNKSLAALSEKQHKEIRRRWISVRYEHGFSFLDMAKWLALFLFITLLITGAVISWNRSLVKEIDKRKKIEVRLRESERKLATLLGNLPGLVYRCRNEKSWPMEFISDGCLGVTGYLPQEISSNSAIQYGDIIYHKDRAYVWQTVQQGITTNQSFEMEYRIVAKNGEFKWVWERGSAVAHIQTGDIHLEGFIADITEQKILADKFQQAQKMEAIGTLAGGIAHDFNNILQAILGNAEMLSEDIPKNSESQADIAEIIQYSRRAAELIKQILAFSRQDDREMHRLNPAIIVKETLKMLHATIPKTVQIKENIDSRTLPVLADATGIQQIVLNLCTNGLQALENQLGWLNVSLASKELTPDFCAELHIDNPGFYTILTVEDSGVGMEEEVQKHIFEPYFTTKDLGSGTGLGLAAVHGIVNNYNGYIRVNSKPREGSKFSVYIPSLLEEHEESSLHVMDEIDVQSAEISSIDKEILLVDDEASVCKIVARQLENKGFKVDTYADAKDALHAFNENPQKYSLVITDQTMPAISGAELAKQILVLDPTIPIILCTGHSDILNEKEALQMGIREYLLKPIDQTTLLRAVQKHARLETV